MPVSAALARNPQPQGSLADIEAEVTYQVGRFLQNQRQPALNEQATVQNTQRFVATYGCTEWRAALVHLPAGFCFFLRS